MSNSAGPAVPSTSTAGPSSDVPGWQLRMQRMPQSLPLEFPSMAPRLPNQPTSLFKANYQTGFLSILYAIGQKPLEIWEKQVRQGHVKRLTDADIRSLVIEILGSNVSTTFITTPASLYQTLGIRLPIMVMVVKNLKRYFAYEIQIMDDTGIKRRYYVSNYQAIARIRPFSTQIPMRLEEGWNQLTINLAELTRKIYGTGYVETLRVQIHANCRLRRIYFCDNTNAYSEDAVPADYKVFVLNSAKGTASDLGLENKLNKSV